MSQTSPTSTSARVAPRHGVAMQALRVGRELVAREHVELGARARRQRACAIIRRAVNAGKPVTSAISPRGGAVRRGRARRGRHADRAELRASISATTRSTSARERGVVAVVLDHPGRDRELVGERQPARRSARAPRRRSARRAPRAARTCDVGGAATTISAGEPGVRAILDEQRGLVEHDARRRRRRTRAIACCARRRDPRVRDRARGPRAPPDRRTRSRRAACGRACRRR